ncbi:hypothetical protein GCM10011391_34530 [Pullulanibacillus camelliae]|uniref:Four-carbon acid sugar kinase family protein n=1 Tax=Pullulanibacillus camelliae TaxID=1707096 RepID=A0A8J3DZZ0_9BACL|nr:four-carbon acid sugar kinase family protein [Pullulanibacillus camelliae]GGE52771.1 hypothetical protein GCM10011391_34530 [Pullulanibacillus camelliae]
MSDQKAAFFEEGMPRPLLAFYGDDFTGSTDVMEALTCGGMPTVLFLKPPSSDLLKKAFPHIQAFGIAGVSRSLSPEEMEQELLEAFSFIQASQARVCHYKICSTFDSSPEVGSIGRAIDIALKCFSEQRFIPIVAGVPALKRYTLFGHHFATLNQETYRLDRHPIMSQHPMTPMKESDLRLHLSYQTDLQFSSVNILELSSELQMIKQIVDQKVISHPMGLLFDVLDEDRLKKVGQLIWEEAADLDTPLFVVGSSGIEYGLTEAWQASDAIPLAMPSFNVTPSIDPLLVISGSCSMLTQSQIDYALDHGFKGLKVSGEQCIDPLTCADYCLEIIHQATKLIEQGNSVVIYSAHGPADASIARIKQRLVSSGLKSTDTSPLIGQALGSMCREILRQTGIGRLVVAGGDTSGFVLKELEIYALEMVTPLTPGGPLCKAYSEHLTFDGLELCLKGGQVGPVDFFQVCKNNGTDQKERL